MSFSAVTIRDAIVSVLEDANTTGSSYDISAGLFERVAVISAGSQNTPVEQFPYITVRPVSKTPEEAYIGNSGRRDVACSWELFCAVNVMNLTNTAEDDIYRLTDNIETLFQNMVDLSGTVSWSEVGSVSWSTGDEDSTYSHSGTIELRTMNNGVI